MMQDYHPESEKAIKVAVLRELYRRRIINAGAIIASECQLAGLSRRIDLAIIDKKLIGIEIKSRFDDLSRLDGQIFAYNMLFDCIFIVVAEKHADVVITRIPTNASLWVFCSDGSIKLKRHGSRNRNLSAIDLANTLTLNDMRTCVGAAFHRGMKKRELAQIIADNGIEYTKKAVHKALCRRHGDASKVFWTSAFQSGSFCPDDVESLSRFKETRLEGDRRKKQKSAFWAAWAETLDFSTHEVA